MATQDRTEAAKQGSTQALASLINATLQPKGIIASVTKKGNQLTIKLQSQNVPDQNAVMKFLKTGMQKIKPLGISQVQVQAAGGGLDPCWEDSFPIIESYVSQARNGNQKQVGNANNRSSQVPVNTSRNDENTLESINSFIRSRNGERVVLVAATFLATSILWLVSLAAINGLNRFLASVATPEIQSGTEGSGDSSSGGGVQEPGIAEEVVEEPPAEPGKDFLMAYLDMITTSGLSGTTRWCAETEALASSLYSPRSYEILSFSSSEEMGSATVRIESSNKGGMPIVQNWSVYIKRGPTVYEKETREDGNAVGADQINQEYGNWCISMLLE